MQRILTHACKGGQTALNFKCWGPFIFYEGGGAGGIWEAPFKNRMTPPQLTNFFTWPPLIAVIFWDAPPPKKKKLNKRYLDFNFLNISLLSPYFTFCAHCEDNIYNPHTTESCCLKNKSKERDVNFGSPSYGSP